MRRTLLLAVSLTVLIATSCNHHDHVVLQSPCDQPHNQVMAVLDVRYGARQHEVLDLYLPWHRTGEPLVLLIHGGGWRWGDRRPYGHIARFFARCGIAAANIDYPTGDNIHADAQAAAIVEALQWLAGRAAVYGFASDRTFLLGHSAGAQIATLAALDKRLPHKPTISGVISIAGFGFAPPAAAAASALPAGTRTLYRAAFGNDASQWRRYDVTSMIRSHEPAFLVIEAAEDPIAPKQDALGLVAALQRLGNAAQYLDARDRDHSSVIAEIARSDTDPVGVAVERFVFSGLPETLQEAR